MVRGNGWDVLKLATLLGDGVEWRTCPVLSNEREVNMHQSTSASSARSRFHTAMGGLHLGNAWKGASVATLSAIALVACGGTPVADSSDSVADEIEVLEFGVGPYFPTPNETREQFEPLFEEIAAAAGVEAKVVVTEDWIGISEALRSGTLDVAWLGPWGYVLAEHNEPSLEAIATVKYNEEPIYYSILMAKADAPFDSLDEAIEVSAASDELLSLSLADVGSTSGWLIPSAEFLEREVDPEAAFDYSEGASHAAQAIAVLSDQVDIASDFDRNLDVLDSTGRIEREELKIVWQSDPLPNDPIVVRGGLPDEIKEALQDALVSMTPEEAETLLPENYTGFVSSDGSNYQPIRDAGSSLGKLQ
ncbi:MAG: phosphate/phosphite/phosphonate ABC transporter substrate-binding protein [Cyanobacteria bacterium P01_G01_bin.4]